MDDRAAGMLAGLLFLPARVARRLVPARVRQHLEDRLFYAIFQMTRVTNDAYKAPAAGAPAAKAPAAKTSPPPSTPPS